MTGFLAALDGLPDNPVARRELRGLSRQLADWRFWCYLQGPRSATAWAVRAVAWCAPAPYLFWAFFTVCRLFWRSLSIDLSATNVLGVSFLLIGVSVAVIAAAIMSPSLASEREKETWGALRSALSSRHEILLGLLAGRVAPVLAAFLAAGMFWTWARPHYAPGLHPYSPGLLSDGAIALLVCLALAVAAAAGMLGLAASAWCRSSSRAAAVTAGLVGLLLAAPVLLTNWLPQMHGAVITVMCSVTAAVVGYVAAYWGLERDE